jgi:ribose/xylose/arabinose/galactoside ABC-type transport system permease subunit
MSKMITEPEASSVASTPARRSVTRDRLFRLGLEYAMVPVLIALLVAATIAYPGFLSSTNVSNIISQNAPLGLVAIGMTFIIIGGGFDLSVGSIYALTAVLYAGFARTHSLPVAAAGALGCGILAGVVNGTLITRFRVNPFVATLGSSSAISGLALVYSDAYPIIAENPSFQSLGTGRIGGFPIASIILVVTFVVAGFVLHRTVYGRAIFALGGNWEAARLSGLRVDLLRASTYALTGLLTGIAGLIIASRLNVGQPDIGTLLPLDAIAVVVIGGTSLLGGDGAMWRTAIGLAILATLTNLFYAMSVDVHWQLVIKGLIIVVTVALDAYVRRTR